MFNLLHRQQTMAWLETSRSSLLLGILVLLTATVGFVHRVGRAFPALPHAATKAVAQRTSPRRREIKVGGRSVSERRGGCWKLLFAGNWSVFVMATDSCDDVVDSNVGGCRV